MKKPFYLRFVEGVEGGTAPDVEDSQEETETETSETETSQVEDSWDRERAMAKIKKANAEARQLRERAVKAEEAVSGKEDLERENQALQQKVLQMEVAQEIGIPFQIASRLTGSTREELIEDAKALLDLFPQNTPPARLPNMFGEGHQKSAPAALVDLDKEAAGFMNN